MAFQEASLVAGAFLTLGIVVAVAESEGDVLVVKIYEIIKL